MQKITCLNSNFLIFMQFVLNTIEGATVAAGVNVQFVGNIDAEGL